MNNTNPNNDPLTDLARIVGIYQDREPKEYPAPYWEGYEHGRQHKDRMYSLIIMITTITLLVMLYIMIMITADQHLATIMENAPAPTRELVGLPH